MECQAMTRLKLRRIIWIILSNLLVYPVYANLDGSGLVGVEVSLSSSVTVPEGIGYVRTCVTLSAAHEDTEIIIEINTENGTANSRDDYEELTSLMLTVTVGNGSSVEECFNISIIDDTMVEPNQFFVVILSSSDPQVMIKNQQQSITITDNDVIVQPLTNNVQVDDIITLSCEVTEGAEDTFMWTKPGDNTIIGNSSILNITINNSEDGGVYTCSVSNDDGYGSANLTINVSPVISVPPMNMTVASDTNVVLTCEASGFPAPVIEWQYDGDFLTVPHLVCTMTINMYQVQSNLTLFNTAVSHSGTYSCIATSRIDNRRDSDDAILVVRDLPVPVVNLTATVINTRNLTLSWDDPHTHSSPVIIYMVTFMNPTFVTDERLRVLNTTENTLEVRDLYPGIKYTFTIVTLIDVGESVPSLSLVVYTEDEPPASPPPNVLLTTLSSTSIRVNWNEIPLVSRNGNITMYEITYTPLHNFAGAIAANVSTVQGTNKVETINNLEENVSFNISIRAHTSAGPGPFSVPKIGMTAEAAPSGPPTNLSVIAESPTMILVSWNEVNAIDQNGVITGYQVSFTPLQVFEGPTGNGPLMVSGSNMLAVVHNLQEYVNYSISVAASTSVGLGPSTSSITVLTKEAAPSNPPSNFMAVANSSTSIDAIWNEVPAIDQNGVIIVYELMLTPLDDFGGLISALSINLTASNLSFSFVQLEEYVRYRIVIRAYTEEGPSPESALIVRTLEAVPANSPSNVTTRPRSSTSIAVMWNEIPPIERNGPIIIYEISYSPLYSMGSNNVTTVSGTSLSASVTNLKEMTEYTIEIRAYTNAGAGPSSDPVVETTLEGYGGSQAIKQNFECPSSSTREEITQNTVEGLIRRFEFQPLGQLPSYPASSCREVSNIRSGIKSGYYWISSEGLTSRQFCSFD